MTTHEIVGREKWEAARAQLLESEKEHTRAGDELARRRRELPWVAIEQEYVLETDEGPRGLAELFDGRSQLFLYHFMFGTSYEVGCPVNSSIGDALDGLLPHLHARDTTLMLVSSAPQEKLRDYKTRMGWSLPWVSSADSTFNRDFGAASTAEDVRGWGESVLDQMPPVVARNAEASGTDVIGYLTESPAITVFTLEDGVVYETYAAAGRGVEVVMPYYPILDRTPKGRDEGAGFQMWIRRHDEYR